MRANTVFIALISFLLITNSLHGQDRPAEAPIQKVNRKTVFMPGIRFEYFYKKNSCVYYSADYNFNKDYRYRVTNSTRIYNRIGIEANASGPWYIGASASHRLGYTPTLNMGTIKTNLSHRGKIGSIQFIKDLSVEYIHHFNQPFFKEKKDIQASIGVALYKKINVFNRPLGIMGSYRVIRNSNLQTDVYKYRKIDFTKLRLDVTYGITESLYIGLFAMRETEYYYPPGSSTLDPPVNIYYKENSISPVLGITLSYVIKPEMIENYIPGLPFRQ